MRARAPLKKCPDLPACAKWVPDNPSARGLGTAIAICSSASLTERPRTQHRVERVRAFENIYEAEQHYDNDDTLPLAFSERAVPGAGEARSPMERARALRMGPVLAGESGALVRRQA